MRYGAGAGQLAALLGLCAGGVAMGQPCEPYWGPGFEHQELDGPVYAAAWFDEDGDGPAEPVLYVGGAFKHAGGAPVAGLARLVGGSWRPVGGGLQSGDPFGPQIDALLVHDEDGAGPGRPVLFVGGFFSGVAGGPAMNVAAWDGQAWVALGDGIDEQVLSLCSFDADGLGPRVYTAGLTGEALRRWNGAAWEAVGGALSGSSFARVSLVASVDLGSGPALYASGTFAGIDGVSAQRIARWDGSAWSALGPGLGAEAQAVVAFDPDGPGPAPADLVAAGNFGQIDGVGVNRVARWDGAAWHALGSGLTSEVDGGSLCCPFGADAVVRDDDGPGPRLPALFVCGEFLQAGGVPARNIARWDGTAWQALASGVTGGFEGGDAWCLAFRGQQLVVGGDYRRVGATGAKFVSAWDGKAWSAIGPVAGPDGEVQAMAEFGTPDGSGDAPIYVAGRFSSAGGVRAGGIARLDADGWHGVGEGLDGAASVMLVFDADGSGADPASLIVGGEFSHAGGVEAAAIARWDGAAWSAVDAGPGLGLDGQAPAVSVLVEWDQDGAGPGAPSLFVGGAFDSAGGAPASGFARWDSGGWTALPGVHVDDGPGWVNAMAVFDDDGPGPRAPALFVAGFMNRAGGVVAQVARWDGQEWTAADAGLDPAGLQVIYAMRVVDLDGPGPEPAYLYAAGSLAFPGLDYNAAAVGRFDGNAWEPVMGLLGEGWALAEFDDGSGAGLYAGGFVGNDALGPANLARWNGVSWTLLGTGSISLESPFLTFEARSLLPTFRSTGRTLYLGGYFLNLGEVSSQRIGRLMTSSCVSDVNRDGFVNGDDFDQFLDWYAAGDAGGDVDEDGDTDPDDYELMFRHFVAGC